MSATTPPRDRDQRALLQECVRLACCEAEDRPRRWGRQPTPLQCLQQHIRQEVVDCALGLQKQGLSLERCGALLHVWPRTLRSWIDGCCSPTLALAAVGRPAPRSPLPVREKILDYLKLIGPGIGVPTLQQHFHKVPRAELADLLVRYRAVYRARHTQCQRILHWQTPGRVLAADFTEPSRYGGAGLPPIADLYPYVLAVRDLASGCMLAWQPLPNLTEEVTTEALARLFALHGAPLVLKIDNGSAFRAAVFQGFLQASGVIPLYSPPACPMYNGAIEAAIGSLKKRTEEQARQQGRSGSWEPADLEAAQSAANASHPRRLNGRTPYSVWQSRTPIDKVERVAFALTVDRQRFQVRDEQSIDQEESLDHWRGSAVDRRAIERALVEHGHLLFTGRRIPLVNKAGKVTADV
ncbi:MAG TPA: transposase family protein [Gemmataceae bacterium]|nr:transposase family protein [Gemmataceae bacterium]